MSDTIDFAGTVSEIHAQWNGKNDRIMTYAVLRNDAGDTITVRQPGGTVDGVGMVQFPSPALLRAGDRVELSARSMAVRTADPKADKSAADKSAVGSQLWDLHQVKAIVRARPAPAPTSNATATSTAGSAVHGQFTPAPQEFVRTVTKRGTPLYWASGCVYVSYDEAGTSHIPGTEEFDVIDQVFSHWQGMAADCSYMKFQLEGPRPTMEVGLDGINLVKFRDDEWCRPDDENTAELNCHAPEAAGITTLFFVDDPERDRDGEILDADIEINAAVRFSVSVNGVSDGPTDRCLSDLANTLTHEVGHLLGLDHTCRFPGEAARLDHNGDEVPLCNDRLPQDILDTTMYATQQCGESKKASLAPDDVEAACNVYPLASEPNQCRRVDLSSGRGCAISAAPYGPDHNGHGALLSLMLAGLAIGIGRRHRRRHSQ